MDLNHLKTATNSYLAPSLEYLLQLAQSIKKVPSEETNPVDCIHTKEWHIDEERPAVVRLAYHTKAPFYAAIAVHADTIDQAEEFLSYLDRDIDKQYLLPLPRNSISTQILLEHIAKNKA